MGHQRRYIIKYGLIFLFILVLLFSSIGCKKTDAIDEEVQSAVETYFTQSNGYSCFLELYTQGASDPEDPVDIVTESYAVIVDRQQKTARVTLLQVIRYPGTEDGSIDWETQPAYKSYYKSWYITVDGNTVTLYEPQETYNNHQESFYGYGDYTYEKIVYDNAKFADAVNALFFPNDMEHIRGTFVSSSENTYFNGTLNALITNRNLSFDTFIKGIKDATGNAIDVSSEAELKIELYTETPDDTYAYIVMDIQGVEDLIAQVYEAYTGEPYQNDYTDKGLDYEQNININYYEEMLYNETLTLPDID